MALDKLNKTLVSAGSDGLVLVSPIVDVGLTVVMGL